MSLLDGLNTEDKSSLVNAINEVLGKQLIADAIGEPLNSSDTFRAMSEDINGLLNTFKANMMNKGVTVESNDKFKQLIDKIKGLTKGEGNKGIQYASGSMAGFLPNYDTGDSITFNIDCDFVPTVLFLKAASIYSDDYINSTQNIFVSNLSPFKINPDPRVSSGNAPACLIEAEIKNITNNSFVIYIKNGGAGKTVVHFTEWYAIEVGEEEEEEDTAYVERGSLSNQGVTNENVITFTAKNLAFTPSLVYATAGGVSEQIDVDESRYYDTLTITNEDKFVGASQYNTIEVNIIDKGFEVKFISGTTGGSYSSLGWKSIYGLSYTAIK
jgi:hypothetical protein